MLDLRLLPLKRLSVCSISLLCAASVLTGCCGSGTNSTTTSTTTTGGGTTNPTNRPVYITVTPDGKYVYVADAGTSSIYQYSIGSNGALTALSPAMVTANISKPRAVAVSEDSQFVYVGNQGNNSVAAFKIGTNGTLTALSQAPVKVNGTPSSLVVGQISTSPADFLFVGHTGGIARFGRNADGTLTSLGADTTSVGPVADMSEGESQQDTFSRQGSQHPLQIGDNYFLHVLNASSRDVVDAEVNSDGTLTINPQTFPTGNQPAALVASQAGTAVFALNQGANSISSYSDNSGVITGLAATIPVGSAPVSGADIAGDGTDALLVVNSGSNTVSVFSYVNDPAPTSLQTLGNAPTGLNPAWIAIAANGQSGGYNGEYVYVANQSGSISQYVFNINGTLTPLSPSSVKG